MRDATFGVLQIILIRYVVVFAFMTGSLCLAYSLIKSAKLSNSSEVTLILLLLVLYLNVIGNQEKFHSLLAPHHVQCVNFVK